MILKASFIPTFSSIISNNLSFGTIMIESLTFLSSSSPRFGKPTLFLPSQVNGYVTTETFKAPISFAAFAIIAAAPVPVPPPRPAAMKTISAPFKEPFISS